MSCSLHHALCEHKWVPFWSGTCLCRLLFHSWGWRATRCVQRNPLAALLPRPQDCPHTASLCPGVRVIFLALVPAGFSAVFPGQDHARCSHPAWHQPAAAVRRAGWDRPAMRKLQLNNSRLQRRASSRDRDGRTWLSSTGLSAWQHPQRRGQPPWRGVPPEVTLPLWAQPLLSPCTAPAAPLPAAPGPRTARASAPASLRMRKQGGGMLLVPGVPEGGPQQAGGTGPSACPGWQRVLEGT